MTVQDPESPPADSLPRICYLKKHSPDQEYGFDLHADKTRGQFIGNVDADSPAGIAGLRKGDRILAVNGQPVGNENHKEVVRRIKEIHLECRFVVIEEPGFLWYSIRKMCVPIPEVLLIATQDHEISNVDSPKSQKLNGTVHNLSNGSVSLHNIQDNVQIQNDACAILTEKLELSEQKLIYDNSTGLTETEIFVNTTCCEVSNGLIIEEVKEEVVVKQNGHVKSQPNGHVINEELPRLCNLQKSGPDEEYGFNLHAEKNKGHFVGQIDQGAMADKAGLRQGYRIVGVNGTLVHPKTPHKEVVALIKEHELKTTLLIASPELDAEYAAKSRTYSFSCAEIVCAKVENGSLNGDVVDLADGILNLNNVDLSQEEDMKMVDLNNSSQNGKASDLSNLSIEKLTLEHDVPKANISGSVSSGGDEDRLSAEKTSQHNVDVASIETNILRMSASEMREKLLRVKKFDPRKESMPIKKKYEIIDNL